MIPAWQMEGYQLLRTEVLKAAVDDYYKALKKTKRIGEVCTEQVTLEAWFLSPWGQLLSGNNGEFIIEKCRKNYINISNHGGKQHIPDDIQQRIYKEYKDGAVQMDIAKRYKVSSKTIYDIVRRWQK